MKVAVHGLPLARVLPSLWAFDVDVANAGEQAAALVCDDADEPRPGEPPRVVCTAGPWRPRERWPAALVRWPGRALAAPAAEPAADAAVAELLAALRHDYTRQLPQALAELAQAVIDARLGVAPLADARMLAHRLRGTAGSYGHRELGEAAGRLEAQLAAGELASGPLARSLAAVAAPVVAALDGAGSGGARLLVIGATPVADGLISVPDLAAAAAAVAAGEAHALWLCTDAPDMAALDRPGLRDIPVAVVQDAAGAAATAALALWSGAWARLFGPA